jgi:heme/copper-type cytochrome/quinol oxidase subunit 1
MTSGESSRGRSGLKTWRKILVPLVAVASAVVGIIVVATPRPAVGWFAYAPLSTQPFSSDQLVFMDGTAKAGYGLILAGLLALAFWAGYHLALRRVRRQD